MAIPLLFLAGQTFAQGTDVPIQDERLDVAACMIVAENLPSSYRVQLYRACLEIPEKLCLVRGSSEDCLRETAAQMIHFYRDYRELFPEQIEGSDLAQRSYSRKMQDLDLIFSGDIPCGTDATQAMCRYTAVGAALKDLFHQAQRADLRFDSAAEN